MVSGNPPRHSKSTDEPVTIDLDAQDFAAAADAEKHRQSEADDLQTTAAAEGETPAESSVETKDETPFEQSGEHEGARVTEEPETPAETITRDPEPTFVPDAIERKPAAQTSTLVAAGIVGGLIALICVGAIQYAGLLPSSSSTSSSSASALADLSGEMEGLKQTVANLAANPVGSDGGALAQRVAALETSAKTPATGGGDPTAVAALNQKIAELSGQLDQLRSALAQSADQQASTGSDISNRLAEAEKKLNEPREDVAVAKAIAAAALKAAIDRGGPFLPELDTFAGVAPDDPAVADLRTFAQTGIPSRAELIRQVPDVATAIVEAVNQPDPNQSWSDRLMSSASSLVKVRPVGNVEGDGVEAIAARLEDKVKNGDLPGASTEWNDLPAAGKEASAAFKQSLEARIRVEDLVGGAVSKAVSGAGKEG